jgi:hypothetical protein
MKLKKYKYLNYVPAPVNLKSNIYDLVNDEAFCRPDGRIPLLIVTQFGIFPSKGSYKGKRDYSQLKGLEYQTVGFIRRAYLSDREYDGIIEMLLDLKTIERIRKKVLKIDFSLWSKLYLK